MSLIKVVDLAYVRYRVSEPELMRQFLIDFGLHEHARDDSAIYMRGTNTSPYLVVIEEAAQAGFIGPAFEVGSRQELQLLVKHFADAVIEFNPAPGGGERVRLMDLDGYQIEFVHGIEPVAEITTREPLIINTSKPRQRLGQFQRPQPGPAKIRRIGHLILRVDDYDKSLAWYQQFGFLVSDEVYDSENPSRTLNGFLKCDRGDEWTDHHTLGLAVRKPKAVDHVAFECLDIDDVVLGGKHLERCGYKRAWGVGRHFLGSQIFDYWRDPHGFKLEHWTDGDLVNVHTETSRVPVGDDGPGAISQWGPMPEEYLKVYPDALSIGPLK